MILWWHYPVPHCLHNEVGPYSSIFQKDDPFKTLSDLPVPPDTHHLHLQAYHIYVIMYQALVQYIPNFILCTALPMAYKIFQ